jgi:hypothetical protein
MRRKLLQDVANSLCPLLVGRLSDDLEVLSELPDGVLIFDVLGASAQLVALDAQASLSLEEHVLPEVEKRFKSAWQRWSVEHAA